MYYKVIKNNKVIDVLDKLVYLKWQPKHKIMVLSDENEAQAILSSNGDMIWHEETLYKVPVEAGHYDSVLLIEIDKYEYEQLRMLNLKTPEEIIDAFVLSLLNEEVL
jgi:hypothetical protein